MKQKTTTDSVILQYVDVNNVIHEVSLADILDGGIPMDDDGEEMDLLSVFVIK
jgi:hypothetical protein